MKIIMRKGMKMKKKKRDMRKRRKKMKKKVIHQIQVHIL